MNGGGYSEAIDEVARRRGRDRAEVAARLDGEVDRVVSRALTGELSAFDTLHDVRVRVEALRRWRLRVEAGEGSGNVCTHNGSPVGPVSA